MLDRTYDRAGDIAACASDVPNWIVVNTQPHRERLAVDNLERQHYITYCPMMRTRVRHARKTRDVLRPLFPSYLFVDIGRERWRPILSTLGVRTVILSGDCPTKLDPRVIEALRCREVHGAIVRPPSPYRIGQEVRMAGGPLDSLVAKIVELDEKNRVVVLLEFLSRPVKVRATVDQLRPF